MKLHIYRGSDGFSALTSDPKGANLPDVHGPWNWAEEIDLDRGGQTDRIGLDTENMEKALDKVEKEGYYLARLQAHTQVNEPGR